MSRKVDHGFDLEITYHASHQLRVLNSPLDQRSPLDGPAVALYEIIQNDGLVTRCIQLLAGVASDVSRTPGDQNGDLRV